MAPKGRKSSKPDGEQPRSLSRQGWKYMTVLLHPDTEKALRHQAIDEERDISRILDDAVRAYLASHKGGRRS